MAMKYMEKKLRIMRYDLIFDYETMGQDVETCPAIDCSVFVFNWDRFLTDPYTFEELLEGITRYKLSVADQVKNHGYKIEKATVQFWERQSPEVLNNIKPLKNDLTLHEFCDIFISMLANSPKIEYWWSRSNVFDPLIIWKAMKLSNKQYSFNEYLKFWRIRDTRTYIDAKFNFTTKNGFIPISDVQYWEDTFKEHDSVHDVAADVLRLQAIHRAENDLEQTYR